jgi:hypothetical protein
MDSVEVNPKSARLEDWLLLVTDCIYKYGPKARLYAGQHKIIVKYEQKRQAQMEQPEMSDRET